MPWSREDAADEAGDPVNSSIASIRRETHRLETWIAFITEASIDAESDRDFANEYVHRVQKNGVSPKRFDPFVALREPQGHKTSDVLADGLRSGISTSDYQRRLVAAIKRRKAKGRDHPARLESRRVSREWLEDRAKRFREDSGREWLLVSERLIASIKERGRALPERPTTELSAWTERDWQEWVFRLRVSVLRMNQS